MLYLRFLLSLCCQDGNCRSRPQIYVRMLIEILQDGFQILKKNTLVKLFQVVFYIAFDEFSYICFKTNAYFNIGYTTLVKHPFFNYLLSKNITLLVKKFGININGIDIDKYISCIENKSLDHQLAIMNSNLKTQ